MCGYENSNKMTIKNGMKKSKITPNKMNERLSYLILAKQRFYCKHCESYFTAETNLVDAYCNISNNTKLAILNKANEIRLNVSLLVIEITIICETESYYILGFMTII